ncbi:MAG TPA: NAD(P)-dependent alcohol dehydrogenase, partial [Parasegetibacter sp.]
FFTGLFRPRKQILGSEFSGIVEDLGPDVKHFRKGDKVFGFDDSTFGGHGEYLTISENKGIERVPENISMMEAAALTEGAHYALCNIRASKIKPGENAMVYGATGAIGSAAVQLLKYFGVTVTAVCNSKNVELVKGLGADRVIDYQTEDFTKTDQPYQLVFDAVGKTSFRLWKPHLTANGVYVSTELGKNSENVFLAIITPLRKGKKVIFPIPTTRKEDIQLIRDLAASGKFKPVIDREYHLDQIVEAYKYVHTGQKTGNVILRIPIKHHK